MKKLSKKLKKILAILLVILILVSMFKFLIFKPKDVKAAPSQVTVTSDTTTTLTNTYEAMNGMSITPGAGDYMVYFSTTIKKNTASDNTHDQFVALYVNGSIVQHTERMVGGDSSYNSTEVSDHPITIQAYIASVGAGQAIEVYWKTVTGTATAKERTLIVQPVIAADISQATATDSPTTTSTTDTQITSMTLTPGAGDYMAYFSADLTNSSAAGVHTYVSIYVNGVQVSHSERDYYTEASFGSAEFPVSTQAYISGVGAGQVVEIKWRTTAGTATINERTFTVQKVAQGNISQVTSTTNKTSISSTYEKIDGMSITPGAGNYLVVFSTSLSNTLVNSLNQYVSIFVNESQITHTERQIHSEFSFDTGDIDSFPVSTHAYITNLGSGDIINVRFKTEGGTLTAHQRTLTLIKLDPQILIKFDEGYGTSTSDTNSRVSAGTITNAIWKTPEFCIQNNCLYYDGSGDKVSFTDNPNLDFISTDDFTLEGWFRTPDITSGQRTLIAKHNATAGGYKVYMDSNGYLNFGIDDDLTWSPDDSVSTTATPFDDNKWHFFSAVKTGTTSITLYVDGTQYQTDSSIAASGTLANTDSFYLGIDGDGSSNGFSGFIDELKIYRSARTSAEIKTDYAGETPSSGINATFGPATSYLSNGLIGYWKMDETSGNVTDYSGNSLTLTNNGTATFLAGKFGNGSEHIPASSQYFSTATTITGVKSVSFWTNPDTTTNYYISLTSGAYITSTSGTISATGFTNPKMYVNGVESSTIVADTWQLVTVTTETAIDANQFYIGRQGGNYYDGTIDEIHIYNRTFSPVEVGRLYNFAPGPVAYWKMDENNGTTNTYDSSGNGYTGLLNGILENNWQPGKIGSSINFNGTSNEFTTSSTTVFDTSQPFTISTWIYPETFGGGSEGEIFGKAIAGVGGMHLYLEGSDGSLDVCQAGACASVLAATGASTITTNQWQYVTAVHDGNGNYKLYIDGVDKTSDSSGPDSNQNASIVVGNSNPGVFSGFSFDGKIDDLKVYNYSRIQSQIIEDMNGGQPAPGSPVGSSVAYWKFDEGYGTTANDSSTNNNSLTLSTTSWTNTGKFGKAFNGLTNVRLSRTTDPDLEFSAAEDFTLSIWYKSDSATNPAATEYLMASGGPAGSAGYAIYANTSGNICFGIDDDTSWGPDVASCTPTDVYDNTWHHIVAVRNVALDTTKIYIDAVEKDSDADTTTATLDSSPTFYIGDANATDGTDEFLGDIDEVKIFRSALSSNAVKVLYNQSSGQNLGSISTDASNNPSNSANDSYCPPGQGSTCTPPIGHWKIDEGAGSNAYDSSGNGYTGVITNASWSTGKIGSAMNFAGGTDTITITGSLSTKSVEFWINPTTTTQNIMDLRTSATAASISVSSGTIAATGFTSPTTYVNGYISSTLIANTWQHVSITTETAISADAIRFGRISSTSLSGKLDDIRIYDYARTPAQIAWDMNQGKPIGWWKLDENTGTTANDSSGNITAGTLTNSPTWVTGKFNTGVSFAGSDQQIIIADDSDLDFADDESMSITGWFKHSTASTQEVMLSKFNEAGYKIIMESDGDITCALDYDSTWTPTDSVTSTAANYDDGSWHNIACVKTGATSLSLYVDGVLIGTDSSITATNTLTNSDPIYLGIDADGTSNDFTGSLDDVRINRYPLTIQQIKTIMNNGAAVKY